MAIDVRDDKLDAALGLGATHAINGAKEDVGARIRELTDGRGVDVAFEALGRPETFVQATSIVRAGGRAVMVGIAPAGATAPVEITPLVRRGVSIVGSYGASTRADLSAVIALARNGAVDVSRSVTRRYGAGPGRRGVRRAQPGRDRRPGHRHDERSEFSQARGACGLRARSAAS